MKFAFCLVVLTVLVATATAATAIGNYSDSNYPGKCVVNGLILSSGQQVQMNDTCGYMTCDSNQFVEFYTCGAVLPPNGFKLGKFLNPQADYPECCDTEFVMLED